LSTLAGDRNADRSDNIIVVTTVNGLWRGDSELVGVNRLGLVGLGLGLVEGLVEVYGLVDAVVDGLGLVEGLVEVCGLVEGLVEECGLVEVCGLGWSSD